MAYMVRRFDGQPLWEADESSEEAHTIFAEGDCWALAWHVAKLTGGQIYVVSNRWPGWDHVVVQVGPDAFLDVEGIHTAAKLRKDWGGRVFAIDSDLTATLGAYEEWSGGFIFMISHGEVAAFARLLVDQHVDSDSLQLAS